MDEEMLDTKQFFESHHVPLSDLWLESCINWFREQQAGVRYSRTELRTKVYEQWLLLDLRNVEIPQLIPSQLKEKKALISRNLSLQMMSVTDISKPKLGQLQGIRNDTAFNHSSEQENEYSGNSKRVLLLVLTDGIHEVKAMEYRPVPCLNVNLVPGVKIRINAPVTIRRGQLMLEQHNVKLLGGEVEEISVSHAAENILARALNLPENPNPNKVDESLTEVNVDVNTTRNINNLSNRNISSVNTLNTNNSQLQIQPHRSDHNKRTNPVQSHNRQSNQADNDRNVSISEAEQEEFRIAEEIDMLLDAEADVTAPVATNRSRTPDMFADDDFNVDDFDSIDINPKHATNPNNSTSNFKSLDITPKTERKPGNCSPNLKSPEEMLELEDDIFTSFDIDKHLDSAEEEMRKQTEQRERISISELMENKKNKVKGKFKVHAKFNSVVQKLTVDEVWSIQISVVDHSGELVSAVHTDVISHLIGHQPSAVMALRKDVEKDPEVATTIINILAELKEKLLNLNCVMEVETSPDQEVPTIIALY